MFGRRELLKLFWPILVEQFLAATIGIANTMMVSGVGSAAISAVGVVDSINFLVMNLFTSLASGATVMIAQYYGADRLDRAEETINQTVTACVAVALLTGAAIFAFDRQVLALLFPGTEPAVADNAAVYLRFSAVSYPFLAAFSIGAGVLRACRNTKTPMFASVFINVVNLGISAVAIYGLGMGVAGAGLGMLCARVAGAVMLVGVIRGRNTLIRMTRVTFRWTREIMAPVLRIGVPAGIDSMIFNGGKLVVAMMIASLGTASIAANSIAGSVNSLVMIPGNAIVVAATTVIGIAAGAGDKKEIRRQTYRLNLYATGMVVAVLLVFAPFVTPFLGLYRPEPAVLDMARQVTYLTLVCLPLFWPMAFLTPACLRSTGDAVYVTAVSVASMWIFRVAGAWLVGIHFGVGLFGIWIFWCADWAVRGVCFFLRVFTGGYEKSMRSIR